MWDPEPQMAGKASRRRKGAHCRVARATEGGIPQSCGRRLSGSSMFVYGAHGSRCPTPPRHALLAESLGKLMGWTPPDGIDVPKWRSRNPLNRRRP